MVDDAAYYDNNRYVSFTWEHLQTSEGKAELLALLQLRWGREDIKCVCKSDYPDDVGHNEWLVLTELVDRKKSEYGSPQKWWRWLRDETTGHVIGGSTRCLDEFRLVIVGAPENVDDTLLVFTPHPKAQGRDWWAGQTFSELQMKPGLKLQKG